MASSMDQLNTKDWGVEETCQYLREKNLHQFEGVFREKKLTVVSLRNATTDVLASLGFEDKSDITKVLDCFRKLWKTAVQGKVFNDPIHGHVELHPLLVKIIDTPQFQRLRYIKQLGGIYFVFPGASHNRFEHSIGVAYLAGLFAQVLSTKAEHLGITPEDILCVQIAGLCHDLGHGPFSKVFEEMFISEKCPDWKCKEESAKMFDLLMKSEDLKNAMMHYNLDLTKDMVFIKEMIRGPENTTAEAQWPYKGRTEDKSFLYEIVANEKNGIDVVKFDYLARDCYHLGIPLGFDYHRCLKFSRVCKVNEQRHICFRDKELNNLCNMFYTRNNLHRQAYQHKTSKIIQIMIRDAFLAADEHIQIEGSEGEKSLSTALDDPEAYIKLTDNVFETILNSPSNLPEAIKMLQDEYEKASDQEKQDPHMKKKKEIIDKALKASKEMAQARQILQRIVSRKIYRCLGKKNTKEPTKEMIQSWKNDLAISPPQGDIDQVTLRPKDLEIVPFNTGPGNQQHENFINNTYFYRKSDPNKAFQFPPDEVSMRLPKLMSEQFVMVYCKNSDEEVVDAAKRKFDQWCKGQDSQDGGEATPDSS